MSKTYNLYTDLVEDRCESYVSTTNSIAKINKKLAKASVKSHPKKVACLNSKLVKLQKKQTSLVTKISFSYPKNVSYLIKHLD